MTPRVLAELTDEDVDRCIHLRVSTRSPLKESTRSALVATLPKETGVINRTVLGILTLLPLGAVNAQDSPLPEAAA